MRTCVCMYVRACMCVCLYLCECVCVFGFAPMCMPVCALPFADCVHPLPQEKAAEAAKKQAAFQQQLHVQEEAVKVLYAYTHSTHTHTQHTHTTHTHIVTTHTHTHARTHTHTHTHADVQWLVVPLCFRDAIRATTLQSPYISEADRPEMCSRKRPEKETGRRQRDMWMADG